MEEEKQIWDSVECRWVKANKRTWYGASPRNRRVVSKEDLKQEEELKRKTNEEFKKILNRSAKLGFH